MEELLKLWQGLDHVSVLALPGLNGVCVVWEEASKAAIFLPDRLEYYNDFLRAFFSPDIKKVSHNVKDLMNTLLSEGLSTEGFLFDTPGAH